MIFIKIPGIPNPEKSLNLVFSNLLSYFDHFYWKTEIIKTNIIIHYTINHFPNHFIHNYFPILIKHDQWKNWWIIFFIVFDTLYCDFFECRLKHFDKLIYMVTIFLQCWMCHISNMKLMNSFLLDCIHYLFLPCASMAIYLGVLLIMF